MLGTVVFFLVALGVLVFVHELGHFLVAKRAGIRVERFSLGFPPKAIGFQWGETEYCISWIPIGGYVKVAGMADFGAEAATGAPWEFNSKPTWVRMALVAAGPAMNLVFALVALVVLFRAYGIDTFSDPLADPSEGSVAAAAGLRYGDRIVALDGRPVADAYELLGGLDEAAAKGALLELRRGEDQLSLRLPPARDDGFGLRLTRPATVGHVVADMPAAALGLRPGDRVVAVAGEPVVSWTDMSARIRHHPGQPIELVWQRDGQPLSATVTPAAVAVGGQSVGQIGIGPETAEHSVGIAPSLALAMRGVVSYSGMIVGFLGELLKGDRSPNELGGPLRIAQLAGETAQEGFRSFVGFLAMLSVNLAVVNLLPVPALDGGQLLILALEAVRRRPLSGRQREVVQQIGLAILLFVMVLVTLNDLQQMVFHRVAELFQ
jgi:regulator of sigma E protease